MTFHELGLSEPLLRALAAEGSVVPTAIQSRAIPCLLAGRDLLGTAQTGTGKTAAFALPVLDRLLARASSGQCSPGTTRALVFHAKPYRTPGARRGDTGERSGTN